MDAIVGISSQRAVTSNQEAYSYLKPFLWLVTASAVLIVVSSIAKFPPLWGMFGGLMPLIAYHFLLLRRASRGLNQAAIDSVYYFGFLVTVIALGTSALHVSTHGGKADLSTITIQFGLGLLATGFAVLARIWLTAAAQGTDERTAEVIFDEYVQRSTTLVTNIELASANYESFANLTLERTKAFAEKAGVAMQGEVKAATSSFAEEIRAIAAEARASLTEIRGMVADLSFESERKLLSKGIRQTVEEVGRMNESFSTVVDTTQSAVQQIGALGDGVRSLRDGATAAGDQLTKSIVGPLGRLGEELELTLDNSAAVSLRLKQLSVELGVVAETAIALRPGMDEMREGLGQLNGEIKVLKTASKNLATASQSLASAGSGVDTLAVSASAANDSLGRLSETGVQLLGTVASLQRDVANITAALRDAPLAAERFAVSVGSIQKASAAVAGAAEVLEPSFRRLSDAAASSVEILGAAGVAGVTNATVQNFAKLGEASSDLSMQMSGIHDQLGALMKRMEGVMFDARTSLEGDVRKSTQAVGALSESLSTLADHIITRTQEHRTAV